MTGEMPVQPFCAVRDLQNGQITLAHGSGGALTQLLIDRLFRPAFSNVFLDQGHDGAILPGIVRPVLTTDSYVVQPLFFPGGDIGSLAVHGTLNDLAMCGAKPLYLSVGFVLEEGLEISVLDRIVKSMAVAAETAGVNIVTGDTKVIEKHQTSGLIINTAGIGDLGAGNAVGPHRIMPGDVVIVSGDIARHGIAVMATREGLDFGVELVSDCADVSGVVMALIEAGIDIHCLRDPTRGGLAGILIEMAEAAKVDIGIEEAAVPVAEDVAGACEVLGLDPLYVACEGRFVTIVPDREAERVLRVLRGFERGKQACVIGRVETGPGRVALTTSIGTQRPLDRLSGEQMPRIC